MARTPSLDEVLRQGGGEEVGQQVAHRRAQLEQRQQRRERRHEAQPVVAVRSARDAVREAWQPVNHHLGRPFLRARDEDSVHSEAHRLHAVGQARTVSVLCVIIAYYLTSVLNALSPTQLGKSLWGLSHRRTLSSSWATATPFAYQSPLATSSVSPLSGWYASSRPV